MVQYYKRFIMLNNDAVRGYALVCGAVPDPCGIFYEV